MDCSQAELISLIKRAFELKSLTPRRSIYEPVEEPLLAMIFEQRRPPVRVCPLKAG